MAILEIAKKSIQELRNRWREWRGGIAAGRSSRTGGGDRAPDAAISRMPDIKLPKINPPNIPELKIPPLPTIPPPRIPER